MSKKTKGDLEFILPKDPKEGPSTVSLPKENSSKVTKIIDFHIEDFLVKLNEAVQQLQLSPDDFIKSPSFLIGHQEVSVGVWINNDGEDDEENGVMVGVGDSEHLKSLIVTGNCGNLAFEGRDVDDGGDYMNVV